MTPELKKFTRKIDRIKEDKYTKQTIDIYTCDLDNTNVQIDQKDKKKLSHFQKKKIKLLKRKRKKKFIEKVMNGDFKVAKFLTLDEQLKMMFVTYKNQVF